MRFALANCAPVYLLAACAAMTSESPRSVESAKRPDPRRTCNDRVRNIQPPLVGADYERYQRKCLLELEFEAYVRDRQGCSNDVDCIAIPTRCPFGCGAAIAKRYADDVSDAQTRLLNEYTQHGPCTHPCNPVVATSCVQSRCEARRAIEGCKRP